MTNYVDVKRNAALGGSSLVLLTMMLLVLRPATAYPWGAVEPAGTHQYILLQAFARLQRDPAFAAGKFPPLVMIQNHEGVSITAAGLIGGGPDAAGRSVYSQHYYNPKTKEGNGPSAAAQFFGYLVKMDLNRASQSEGAARAAAYSAHFLADMFVPYHVIGMPRDKAETLWSTQTAKHPGQINIGLSVIGAMSLSYLTPFKGGNQNFNTELQRFVTLTAMPETDWFDPWYYNGNTDMLMVNTSSHVAWEGVASGTPMPTIHQRVGSGLEGYDPVWKNAAPSFTKYMEGQAGSVKKFAVASATRTRSRLQQNFEDPTTSLANAIQAVVTIWRSSFSGLRPSATYQTSGPNKYALTVTIENVANAPVAAVKVQIQTTDCTVKGKSVQTLSGKIDSTGKKETKAFTILTTDKRCNVKIETVGKYGIPDLQYAATETSFLPEAPEVPKAAPATEQTPPTAAPLVSIEGIWKAGTGSLMNQFRFFSGGEGTWITGGFAEADSMKLNFTYTIEGNTLRLRGLYGTDYGDHSPYTVTIDGSQMSWQCIEVPDVQYTLIKQ